MGGITFGKYLPLDSIIHRLDPRAKIIAMMILIISIFFPSGWTGYFILVFVVFIVLILSKIPFNMIVKAMKPMVMMLIFLMIINIFVVKTGYVLIEFNGFKIYSDAIFQTLYIAFRLFLMIMVTTILTASTKPLDLTLGIEDLLKPLKKFGVPSHEIAMLISISLRFIPDLIDETQRILKAQSSRGVDLEEGKIKEKVIAILSLIVPLFVSALTRAEDLAYAMEARGYVPGNERTRYKVLKFGNNDYILIACSLILLALIVVLSFI